MKFVNKSYDSYIDSFTIKWGDHLIERKRYLIDMMKVATFFQIGKRQNTENKQ